MKVRILADVQVEGTDYKPNQVVDLPTDVAKQLAKAGQVDPNPDAVTYCIEKEGAEVIVHGAPKAAADAQSDANKTAQ